MSTLKVDEIFKRTGTGTIAIGQSGDTLSLTGTTNITGNTAITGTLSSTGTSLGKIGQVVNAIDSTNDSFTSATLTAASCTASITPSATSSKILVMYNAPVLMAGTADSYAEMRLFRDTTELIKNGYLFPEPTLANIDLLFNRLVTLTSVPFLRFFWKIIKDLLSIFLLTIFFFFKS